MSRDGENVIELINELGSRSPSPFGHGSPARPGAFAQRAARADHGAHAHLRAQVTTTSGGRASRAPSGARPSRAAAARRRPTSAPANPYRVSNFVGFLLAALLLVPALLVAIPCTRSVTPWRLTSWATDRCGTSATSRPIQGGFSTPRRDRGLCCPGRVGPPRPVQPNRISTTGQRIIHELGGPAANLVVAVVLGFACACFPAGLGSAFELSPSLLGAALYAIVFLNLSIFAFQLLPIPGLDGWR